MKVGDMTHEQGIKVAKSVQQEIFEQQGYMVLEEDILRMLIFFNSEVEGNVLTGEEKSKGLFFDKEEIRSIFQSLEQIRKNISSIDGKLKNASR